MADRAYSAIDRLAHRIAFSHPVVQEILADLSAQLYGRLWKSRAVDRPIFVTSLPRAGTTLMLELLARLPEVATHTYRDMPFVRAPVLWDRLSSRFRTRTAETERAHGDGMMINPDSPEAFEEVVWLAYFRAHYQPRGIRLWTGPESEFAEILSDHMRQILTLRCGDPGGGERYLSKNNANIARIPTLRAAFPDAVFLVPIRDPHAQALSMHRQHLRFLNRHAEDPFARRYMADIGHFEFGADHSPILFEGMAEVISRFQPDQLDYWVGYWVAAYRHLAREKGLVFLDHAGFCANGAANFQRLCEFLGLKRDPAAARAAAALVRPQPDAAGAGDPAERDDLGGLRIEGLAEARALFAELRAQCEFIA